MDRDRSLAAVIAALAALAAAGCGTPEERTRRDLEEVGRADLGGLALTIDRGTVLLADPAGALARFRAGAPSVVVTAVSADAAPRAVTVEVTNVAEESVASSGAAVVAGRKTVSLALAVPPGGAEVVTLAPPGGAAPRSVRFAWVGDVHAGLDNFARVRAALEADAALDFVLLAGDLTDTGARAEVEAFVAAADALPRPWYAVLGNHDLKQDDGRAFQELIGRLDVAFDHGGIRFVLLDSASATLDARAYALLDEALRPAAPLAVVAMHVPPFDPDGWRNAGFASRLEGARVAARLADGRVDLLLCGHLHGFTRDTAAGVPVIVSGNGGVAADGLHYVVVTADAAAGTIAAERIPVP